MKAFLCCVHKTLSQELLPMYNETIRVPQLTAVILFRDVIWHKAYCTAPSNSTALCYYLSVNNIIYTHPQIVPHVLLFSLISALVLPYSGKVWRIWRIIRDSPN